VSLLAALQQADAGFPSGGFAFSNGIEGLAALGQRFDAAGLAGLLAGVLRHRWAGCDRVAVARAWDCGADAAAPGEPRRACAVSSAAPLARDPARSVRGRVAASIAASIGRSAAGSGPQSQARATATRSQPAQRWRSTPASSPASAAASNR